MNYLKLALLCAPLSILVGCNQMRPQQSYAPAPVAPQQNTAAEQVKQGLQAASECTKKNRATPNGKIVESSVLILTDTQANKFDLLSSKAKLNEAQKKAFKQYLSEGIACRNLFLDAYRGLPDQPIIRKDYAFRDGLYTKLLTGQITVGDANSAINENRPKYTEEIRVAKEQYLKAQAASGPGNVIGQAFDDQANGNIYLYDGPCRIPSYKGSYPLRWDAKRADNGGFIGEGCYSLNQQTVTMIATTGLTASRPMSVFQGGGNKSVFQSFAEGLQRATTYWNNSAAQTQNSTTNLTPGLTRGNGMNCTPDGRGGYNCK
jgi:hypothetical protein